MRLQIPKLSLKRNGKPIRLQFNSRFLKRAAVWSLVMLMSFVAFAWINIPTRALAWRIVHEANKQGFNVSIDRLSVVPIVGVNLHDVVWNFPKTPGSDVVLPFVVDHLKVSASPWSYLLFDEIDVTAEAELDEGRIESSYERKKESFHVSVNASDLPLYSIPRLQQTLNAPLRGMVDLNVELDVVDHKWERSNGTIEISCNECSVGDGLTVLNIPGAKGMMAKGVTIPEIHLGNLKGKIVVENGTATIEEMVMVGEDIQLKVSGTMQLNNKLPNSKIDLEIRLMVSQKLQDRDDTIRFMVGSAGKSVRLAAPEEGWFGYSWAGTLAKKRLRGLNSKRKADERHAKRIAREKKRAALRSGKGRTKPLKPSPSRPPKAAEKADAAKPEDPKGTAKKGSRNSLDIPGMVPIKPVDSEIEVGAPAEEPPKPSLRPGVPSPLGAASSIVVPPKSPKKEEPMETAQPPEKEEVDEQITEVEGEQEDPEPSQATDSDTNPANEEQQSDSGESGEETSAADENAEENTGAEGTQGSSEVVIPPDPPV